VDKEDKIWVENLLKDANPEVALLRDGAKLMAEKWLSAEDSQEVLRAFGWLYGYMNKVCEQGHVMVASDFHRFKTSMIPKNQGFNGVQIIRKSKYETSKW
jgi:hypothetical protein